MNFNIAVAVGLAAIIAAVLVPFSTLKPAFAAEVAAEIAPGASGKTTDAFSPNPIEANVGDTVTWTSKDPLATHTVTSGSPSGGADGKFDSGLSQEALIANGETFSHTFTDAGDYPYYCVLHPGMVGMVTVASAGPGPEPEPTPHEFSITATDAGTDYEITGTSTVNATSATINPGQSVVIEFSGGGEVELTLPKAMIDEINAVQLGTETIDHEEVSEDDTTTTISFTVPEEDTTVTILAGFVVPEFPVIAAILAVTIAGIIGYTRFARNGTGFFGRA